ncbi:hypothetical protein [Pelagibius sp. Alg239-R121]|uniref:hypothetical protein n=1 Tax=Pelagibius sp. Alg239-R121 TaxID=2993448 RepID=UPI0024A6A500|nr:hypothetical protein [Pelagibius sp. Alg239-R121]
MNRINADNLYALLPAVHRLRDADEGEPLRALIAVLAREGAAVEENIEQLLDDLFIETCAPWAAPYIGGVIGYRTLFPVEGLTTGTRAEVANTIAYRRRKGTAAVLEQLARDVTGWPARVVEYFQLVATCQHMNHIRAGHHATPDLHDPLMLEPLGRAFDSVTRSVDVRSITQGAGRKSTGGKHNLPNIGIFLWRLAAQRLSNVPATQIDARRYLFDPLGAPRQLVNRQEAETEIESLAQPINVPGDITRRMLHDDPALWYGRTDAGSLRSLEVFIDNVAIPVTRIEACDLSDDAPGWNHSPHDAIDPSLLADLEGAPAPEVPAPNALLRIDPELGRMAFPEPETREVRVTYHTAFPAPIGGGEYNRASSLATAMSGTPVIAFPSAEHATLQDALDALQPDGGIVEITTNDVFVAPATITAAAATEVGLRAADGARPILRAAAPIEIHGGSDARVSLNGLVVEGAALHIVPDPSGASLGAVSLSHMTLVPGLAFTETGAPQSPGAESLRITATGVELDIARSIAGPMRMLDTTNVRIEDCIIDAASLASLDSAEGLAVSGLAGEGDPAGALTILTSTVIGRILTRSFPLVSDAILFARDPGDGSAPVRALRKQEGCMRFSYVPDGSVTPRRYRCQPQLAIDQAVTAREEETGVPATAAERALIALRIRRWLRPSFTALSASAPAYAQLRQVAPAEIRTGASDGGEMGVYHVLFQPQREANLRIRLEEYLRFGLEAGVFFET